MPTIKDRSRHEQIRINERLVLGAGIVLLNGRFWVFAAADLPVGKRLFTDISGHTPIR
jgi:hypothetical protein